MFDKPKSLNELKQRVEKLAGLSLAEISEEYNLPLSADPSRDKGALGQLFEKILGADAGNLSEPDFRALGIELKTVPINEDLKPYESTYVCVAPFNDFNTSWEDSSVFKKLSHVLWLPIIMQYEQPFGERLVGSPFFWEPSIDEFKRIRQDWEELTELMRLGQVEQLSARLGNILQIRPKAANARCLTEIINSEGYKQKINPRGFYLRARFTYQLLCQYFCK